MYNKIYYKNWYTKNKDKKKLQSKIYQLVNKEKYKKYNFEYRTKYREQLKMYDSLRANRKIYEDLEKKPYLRWRKEECELCGFNVDRRILQVHHIDSSLKNTNKDSPKNIITLCRNCHAVVHFLSIEDVLKLNKKIKGIPIEINKLNCPICENKFIPINPRQTYCSKICYNKARSFIVRTHKIPSMSMVYSTNQR
mgnify:CR=1 FL=1